MNVTGVLLVEDNVSFREMVKQHIVDHFPLVIIEEAGDGQEAWTKIERRPPSLIFMDINLPGEFGLAVTKKIKCQYSQIIVAILTSYDLPEYRDAAFSCGADYYFSKGSYPWEPVLNLVNTHCVEKNP
jgi:DNA-binding NarL/FixJ family response regulator